jgi:arylsulfatase A-like enzyme
VRHHLPALLCLLLAAILLVPTGGCIRNLGREPAWGKETTLLFDLDDDVVIPERPVVVFLCDGLHKGTFETMLAAGELPHIKHYLVDRGVSIDAAVASLPTVTFADITSYATGVYPGHHGILGNKWFDPRRLELQNYATIDTMSLVNDDIQAPTIYEILDREKSVVVLTQINRGCTRFYENWMRVGPAWFFKMFRNVSMSTTARLQNTVWAANEDRRWPDLIMLYYPSTDEVAHLYGPDDERYRETIRVFDAEVGDACKAFEKEGFLDKVLLVMVTDHGMVEVRKHFDVAAELERLGLKVWTEAINEQWGHYQRRRDKLKAVDAVVVVDSDRLAKVHFRLPGRSWAHRPTLEELGTAIDSLAALPATQFLVHSDRNVGKTTVTVRSPAGTSRIVRRGSKRKASYVYHVDEGTDPLGYSDHPTASKLVGGTFFTADAWLAATIDTEYPDFVHQLPAMFDHERAGDLVLFAKPGWDFGNACLGGHGGLTRDETVVPMIFAGGGLPKGKRIGHARTLSLVPTIVHFIRGEKAPAIFDQFDADSLLDNLRSAGQNVRSEPSP